MIRLGAFVSHPIQYQAPLFRHLAKSEAVDLTVYFGSKRGYKEYEDEGFGTKIKWHIPLVEGYDHRFLNNITPVNGNSVFRFNPAIRRVLAENDLDAFWVHGFGAIANWYAIGTAAAYDVPVIYRSETTPYTDPSPYRRVRERMNDALFDTIDAFAYIGDRNRRYYRDHGVTDEQLFHAPYTVPNDFFRDAREALPASGTIRREENVPLNRPVVAFAGKLIERKQPELLLDAFVRATEPGEATLLFVGDGDRREALEAKALRLGRRDDTVFPGFVNQRALPRFYEIADVFVLPSLRENWGLVVNEAMNFGIPIVVSDVVGCAPDLIDETTGRVFPSGDAGALSEILSELLADEGCRDRLGAAAADRIADWGIPETSAGIVRAARYVSR